MMAGRIVQRLLALWACAGTGIAQALRQPAGVGACSRLLSKSPLSRGVTFPLDVEGLLEKFHQDKAKFFRYLRWNGIDETLQMSTPNKVSADCIGEDASIIFVGDCYSRMSFEAFGRLKHGGGFAREPAMLDETEDSGEVLLASRERLPVAYNETLRAGYITSFADAPGKLEADLRALVDRIHWTRPSAEIVLWMGAFVHAWFHGESGWTEPEQRKAWQTEFLDFAREAFPRVRLVWDSPTFLDIPLMKALPKKREAGVFENATAMEVAARLASEDRKLMSELGVPITSRWEISNKYRGLQCDGMHASPHHTTKWECPGFPAYEDLILQSGLQQLCLHRPAEPLCE